MLLACISLCGCFSLGNTRLYEDQLGYSRALGDAEKSDTLLNVVRLRYADTPIVLQAMQVISGYQLQRNVTGGFEAFPAIELMFASFPSSFCTDDGRAVINAGAPPISKPSAPDAAAQSDEPEWLATLPAGVHQVYEFWKSKLKPGGFKFTAHIINYPGKARRCRTVFLVAKG